MGEWETTVNNGTCIHFNGLGFGGNYKTQCCGAGVNYFETFDGRHAAVMLRMPCVAYRELPAHGKGTAIKPGEATIRKEIDRKCEVVIPCAHRQEPTPEQVEDYRRESENYWQKTIAALKVANEWRALPKPEKDRAEVIPCPVCGGKLHLFQSAHNGHCHGKCETERCVAWME